MPAETHTHLEPIPLSAVLDLLAVVVGIDVETAAGQRLSDLDLDDDLAVIDLWAAVAEEFGERTLGEFDPLEPRPDTLGELAEAFHLALSAA